MFRRYEAHAFRSSMKLEEMMTQLAARGPWKFVRADNDDRGAYLSAKISPEGFLKIYELKPGHFHADLRYRSSLPTDQAEAELANAKQTLTETVLPAIGATAITPAEPFDR